MVDLTEEDDTEMKPMDGDQGGKVWDPSLYARTLRPLKVRKPKVRSRRSITRRVQPPRNKKKCKKAKAKKKRAEPKKSLKDKLKSQALSKSTKENRLTQARLLKESAPNELAAWTPTLDNVIPPEDFFNRGTADYKLADFLTYVWGLTPTKASITRAKKCGGWVLGERGG